MKALVTLIPGVLTLGACGGSEVPTGREYLETVQSVMAGARCEGRWFDADSEWYESSVNAIGCGTLISAHDHHLPINEIEPNDWMVAYRWDLDPSGTGWALLLEWASDVDCEALNDYILGTDYGKSFAGWCDPEHPEHVWKIFD